MRQGGTRILSVGSAEGLDYEPHGPEQKVVLSLSNTELFLCHFDRTLANSQL